MRTIIAGSREGVTRAAVSLAIKNCGWVPSVVLSGCARGADRLGEIWARDNAVPIEKFPADWIGYPRAAGHIRNALMADNAEALVALWDGKSKGTKHMIDNATGKGLRVYVLLLAPPPY